MTILEDQIRECFGRVVYTHKTHEKMADICGGTMRALKIWQIVFNGITTCGAVTAIFAPGYFFRIATAVVSFTSFSLSAYLKGFDPGGAAQKHRDAAATLWDIRESYLSLLTDLNRGALTDSAATAKRDELQALLAKIYKGVPQTNSKAYKMAQEALTKYEEYTFSTEEIDVFLPDSLRKGSA